MTTTGTKQRSKIDWWKLFVRFQNPMMKWLLRSPLHSIVSQYYMMITFTGRKSGKVYSTPVQYKQVGNMVYVLTSRHYIWWKNLEGGAPVKLIIQGRTKSGQADVSLKAHDVRHAIELLYPSMNASQKDKFVGETLVIWIQL